MIIQLNWFTSIFILLFTISSIVAKSITTEIYPHLTINPSEKISTEYPLSRYKRGLEDYDEEQLNLRQARGMMYEDVTHASQKAIKNDPWQGYYDFLINEGSFKFWAVFQVVTAAILIYSAFAAVYYAKYNVIQADYDYGDYFIGRSDPSTIQNTLLSGLNSQTFQRILDAISSKKYY